MKSTHRTDDASLVAYLEGEVTPSERSAIEVELGDSAELRRKLDQLRNLTTLLAAPAGRFEQIDLAGRVHAALRQPTPNPKARSRRWPALWLGGVAACVGGALFVASGSLRDNEFRAKSNGSATAEGDRWAGVQIYRMGKHGRPERLSERIEPNEGLLFSYTNLGTAPFDYLMIFAVDAEKQVRWFYPAYETAGTNPKSIPIRGGGANVALGELVQQDFAEGPLALYALFTNQPVDVLTVEELVKAHGHTLQDSPVPRGTLQRIETRVAR